MSHANAKAAFGPEARLAKSAPDSRTKTAQQSSFDEYILPILKQNGALKQKGALSAAPLTQPQANATAAPTESRNFGGLLVAPSYQTIPYSDPYDQVLVTLAADFNHDGSPDLATLDYDGNLCVIFNDGKGHFAPPIVTNVNDLTGATLTLVAATAIDLDGDGYPDVVAMDFNSGNLYLFHNHHNGTFDKFQSIPLPASSQYADGSFLLADVNGDGKLDIISATSVYDPDANNSTVTLQTIPGMGGGNFDVSNAVQSSFTYAGYNLTLPNNGVLLQKLNGKLNLVLEAQAYDSGYDLIGVSVIALPSNGDGTFATTPSTEVDFGASYPYVADNNGGLSLADLNNDGYPDITLNFGDDYVYTALGLPDGTFADPVAAQSGFAINPSGWVLVDVNRDGYLDFVDYDTFYTTIWPGKGDGTFADPVYIYSTGTAYTSINDNYPGSNFAVADFNGDGLPDLAIVDSSKVAYKRASIFIGNGDGSFQAAPAVAPLDNRDIFPQSLESGAVLDLNGDGAPDILFHVIMNNPPFPFYAALNDGKGNFIYKEAMVGNPGGLNLTTTYPATGDFNGDGLADVVFAGGGNGFGIFPAYLAVALSNGDGTLKNAAALDMGSLVIYKVPAKVVVGDVNGDGKLDIVAAYPGDGKTPAGFLVALGNGDGTFQPVKFTKMGNQIFSIALADFDGDGKLDLLLADTGSVKNPSLANVSIIYGDGSGTFNPANAQVLSSGFIVENTLVGDLNGDGRPDIVLLSDGMGVPGSGWLETGAGALVYLNLGNRQFDQSGYYEQGRYPVAGLLADFNGDGILDLFFSEYPTTEATATYYGSQILLGNGDGTFGSPYDAQIPPASVVLLPGDYLQNGAVDLVTNSDYGAVAMLINQGVSSVALTASSSNITAGETENISAIVTAALPHRPTPTGTLTLSENGVTVGTEEVLGGTADFTIGPLPVGSHTLTASYSGDSSFNVNRNAASVSFTVNAAPVVTPGISLSANTGSLALQRGDVGTVSLTVSANSSYSGNVSFAASGSLTGLNVQFSPSTVTLTGGKSANVAVVVSTAAPKNTSRLMPPQGWKSTMGGASLAFLIGGLLLPVRRRKIFRSLLIVVCAAGVIVGIAGMSGCSNSSDVKAAHQGTYTLVITATPSVQGASVQAANIAVTVQ